MEKRDVWVQLKSCDDKLETVHRHRLLCKDNADGAWGWFYALRKVMHRVLQIKVYRLFESFLVRITGRAAMAMS